VICGKQKISRSFAGSRWLIFLENCTDKGVVHFDYFPLDYNDYLSVIFIGTPFEKQGRKIQVKS